MGFVKILECTQKSVLKHKKKKKSETEMNEKHWDHFQNTAN